MTVTSSYVFGTTVLPQSDTASPVVYRYCKNARTLVDSERGSLKKCINAVSQTSLSCQGVSCSVRTSNNRLPSNEEPWRWDWCHCKECELKVNFFFKPPSSRAYSACQFDVKLCLFADFEGRMRTTQSTWRLWRMYKRKSGIFETPAIRCYFFAIK